MPSPLPIGIFDSGVGGLSIMKEVRLRLPAEGLLYYADSAYCPYGSRPLSVIQGRAYAICDFLQSQGVKLIVVASNTTSVAALDQVRDYARVPVVGVEPAVKPASELTKNGRVGVLATVVTLAGNRFNNLVERFGNGVEIYTQPCPGLVEQIEAGSWEGPETEALLGNYLSRLLEHDVDTVVLGCTHYPFLRPLVEKMAGTGVKVIDTGEAVAQQVVRVLENNGLFTPESAPGWERFYTSGNPGKVGRVIRLLLQDPGLEVQQVNLDHQLC
ncbi:MAG: glutamate racemase [Firmicutes bacterium]|nr:glutamate racemase [Bacillota bacterium]